MPRIEFPDVPISPGVPNVKRIAAGIAAASGIDRALQKYGILNAYRFHQWGIIDESGNPVLVPNSHLSISIKSESKTSTYPVEPKNLNSGSAGSFSSYNKVEFPSEISVSMIFTQGESGSETILGTLVNQSHTSKSTAIAILEKMKSSASKYSIATPEKIYSSFSLEGFSYKFDRAAAQMLRVECRFIEIRETAEAKQFNAKNAQSMNPKLSSGVSNSDLSEKEKTILQKSSDAISSRIDDMQVSLDSIKNSIRQYFSSISGKITNTIGVK